jgi:hypothetical protein
VPDPLVGGGDEFSTLGRSAVRARLGGSLTAEGVSRAAVDGSFTAAGVSLAAGGGVTIGISPVVPLAILAGPSWFTRLRWLAWLRWLVWLRWFGLAGSAGTLSGSRTTVRGGAADATEGDTSPGGDVLTPKIVINAITPRAMAPAASSEGEDGGCSKLAFMMPASLAAI